MERVAKRPAEVFEADLHDVAFLKGDPGPEAEGAGAEEVDVEVAGLAVEIELKVMMFDVGQAVAHVLLAGLDFA
jgi:hypothetical protein